MKNAYELGDIHKQQQQKSQEKQMLEERLKGTTQGSPEYEETLKRLEANAASSAVLEMRRQSQTKKCHELGEQATQARIKYAQSCGYDDKAGMTPDQLDKIVEAKVRSQRNS